MQEELLSEFTDELTIRNEMFPRDLVEKYIKLGLPQEDIASVLLARSALKSPPVSQAAVEESERKVHELMEKVQATEAQKSAARAHTGPGLVNAIRKFLRIGDK